MIKNKIVIYTALFGDYDDLIEPVKKFENCDFICFTDQRNLKSYTWKIVLIDNNQKLSSHILNRKYKWLPHRFLKDYELSLYIDANIELLKNPFELWNKYCDEDCLMLLPKHPLRNCIYEESIACVARNKTKIAYLLEQMKFYKLEKFPSNFGLGENNIIFRKHMNKDLIELMETLWGEFNRWKAKRDQLNLFYLIWKLNFKNYKLMYEHSRDEKYFKNIPHKKIKNATLLKKLYYRVLDIKKERIDKNFYKMLLKKEVK